MRKFGSRRFFIFAQIPSRSFYPRLAARSHRQDREKSLAAARHSLLYLWLSRITYINHSDKRQRTFVRRLNERALELSHSVLQKFSRLAQIILRRLRRVGKFARHFFAICPRLKVPSHALRTSFRAKSLLISVSRQYGLSDMRTNHATGNTENTSPNT